MSELSNQVYLEIDKDVAVIRLGALGERAVVLTMDRMGSLKSALNDLRTEPVRTLVIMGGSLSMFCAGADLSAIQGVTDSAKGEALAREGQEVFDLLASLRMRKVAAISGPCVGGGCELVLACDERILLDHPSTRIGLPEVKLGILPGFGGTQRLPRLIGLPKALEIILKGKIVPAHEAKRVGLASVVIPLSEVRAESDLDTFTNFERKVLERVRTGSITPPPKLSVQDKFLTFSLFGRSLVKAKTDAAFGKDNRYPAPAKALQSAIFGLQHGMAAGLKEERRLLGELIVSSESKALVHLFQISEEAQKLGRAYKDELRDSPFTVIGGGTMGAGIAAAAVLAGVSTEVIEQIDAVRDRARKYVLSAVEKKRSLSEERKRELSQKLSLRGSTEGVLFAPIVVEAIIEDLPAKRKLYAQIEEKLPEKGILATNTSSLRLELLGCELKRPERFVGLHFFNPAEKMPLVEVIRAKSTSDDAVLRATAAAVRLGKYPIVVEDVPGFLVNRILTPYLVEAAELLHEGYSVQEIDSAAESFGMPMGPLRLLDEIGLDVASKVADVMEGAYGQRMKGHRFSEVLVKKGYLGRKSGRGFYLHSERGSSASQSIRIDLGLDVGQKRTAFSLTDRLILALVAEALRALDEGVAGVPGEEACGQIDLGTVMGIGFPPYRGGVIWYAESIGSRTLYQKLQAMAKELGPRFMPNDGLKERAERDESFYSGPGDLH
jgi:3-hydroxyacyl-CoA dehydrogenase/enoyl-CoA hydratase/3-hydroxybutyryl-CoA epimerase